LQCSERVSRIAVGRPGVVVGHVGVNEPAKVPCKPPLRLIAGDVVAFYSLFG
jgi:hypothetical protein